MKLLEKTTNSELTWELDEEEGTVILQYREAYAGNGAKRRKWVTDRFALCGELQEGCSRN
jgi:hypothetical protein